MLGAGGGALTVSHTWRLTGMGLMFAGALVAFLAYVIPLADDSARVPDPKRRRRQQSHPLRRSRTDRVTPGQPGEGRNRPKRPTRGRCSLPLQCADHRPYNRPKDVASRCLAWDARSRPATR